MTSSQCDKTWYHHQTHSVTNQINQASFLNQNPNSSYSHKCKTNGRIECLYVLFKFCLGSLAFKESGPKWILRQTLMNVNVKTIKTRLPSHLEKKLSSTSSSTEETHRSSECHPLSLSHHRHHCYKTLLFSMETALVSALDDPVHRSSNLHVVLDLYYHHKSLCSLLLLTSEIKVKMWRYL